MRSAPEVRPRLNISNLPDNDYYKVDTVAFATFCYSIQKIPSFNWKLYRQPIYYKRSNYVYAQCIYNNIKLKPNFNLFNHALTTITICNISLLHSVIQRHSMLYYHTMISRHIINQSIIIYNISSDRCSNQIA